MAQEIYHRSEWGNPNEQWGNVYLNADLTNELYKRASEYENSWVTDQLLNGVGTKPSIILTPTAYEDGVLNSVKPQRTFGSELITNGDFSSNSDWNYGSSWSIANGKATATNSTTGSIYQDVLDTSKIYKATFEITEITSGSLRIGIGVNFSDYFTSTGVYTYYGQPTTDGLLRINPSSGTNASIDNVSVKEVIDADFDFTRGSSATRVNELGLVQDVQLLSGELVQNGNFEQIGSEEVTNGSFDTDSGWSFYNADANTNTRFENNSAILEVINSQFTRFISTTSPMTIGKLYKVTYEVTETDNTQLIIQYPNTSLNSSLGTHTVYIEATNANIGFAKSVVGKITIDNVSVKEVGQNWELTDGAFFTSNGINITNSPVAGALTSDGYTALVVGRKYRMTYEIIENNAGLIKLVSAIDETMVSTVGTHTKEFIADQSDIIIFRSGSTVDVTINNISVVEVTDDTDLPRINYTNFDYENGEVVPYSGEGSLLLENQSTNLITYSEDFTDSSWNVFRGSVTANVIISPDGTQNASRYEEDSQTGSHLFRRQSLSITNGLSYTGSIFIKKGELTSIILTSNSSSRWVASAAFDVENGIVTSGTGVIKDYGNGWYRCSISGNAIQTTTLAGLEIYTSTGEGRDGDGLYMYGAMFEQGSYATSYIPTNGSTVTRLADVCNNSGSSDLINSTEGVLYYEAAAQDNSITTSILSISSGSNANTLYSGFSSTSNTIQAQLVVGGVPQTNMNYVVSDRTDFNKIAILYQNNNHKMYVNGVEVAVNTNGSVPSANTFDRLNFDLAQGSFDFYANVKCVAVFKEALSDTELQKLTTI